MIASGEDKEIIESLVTSYIKRPSCIVLLTIACESEHLRIMYVDGSLIADFF